jgi:molybdopterin-guanine dinucleotide biosynthesis protein A
MGRDKALLHIDGLPLAERVARVLEDAGCSPVVFVGGDAAALGAIGRRFVGDRWPGEGPAGGVLTALAALPDADAVVVAACDLPDLTADVVARLASPPPSLVNVARTDRVEPALACWSPAAVGPLAAAFPAERALHRLLDGLGAGARFVDVDAAALRNVNTAADL